MDFDQLTLTQAAAALRAGTVKSTALTTEALARAKANADLNAFVTLDEAGALKAAAAFDTTDDKNKPLGGVPLVIKDNIEVAGLPCSAGTPALRDYVPEADAPVVAKLRAAGAIIIGKTSMHELAFGISGYNTAFKTGAEFGVRNAYDRTLIAGGSSSGTGAAIGARIVAGGLGTDTGGSVRVPAALNGCASLRPTIGRYPQEGIAPISHTRDTAGPDGRDHGRRRTARSRDLGSRGGPTCRPEAGADRHREDDVDQSRCRHRNRLPGRHHADEGAGRHGR
ncbi:Amidase [Bradyrhizobium shewense]|uniref:Indoleacetamide hydrolase n=1 Tax=Bradyrhizobium shewense TaxID=1761772 RepID=A0A1C3XQU2_9BRAD|nr:Amidase [Bradyrhizobium shewense]